MINITIIMRTELIKKFIQYIKDDDVVNVMDNVGDLFSHELLYQDEYGDTSLHHACRNKLTFSSFVIIKRITDYYNDNDDKCYPHFGIKNMRGDTPLHVAIKSDHDNDQIELIIKKSTNDQLIITNNDGDTPLHYFAMHCRNNNVRKLLNKLTDTQMVILNNHGKSPLHTAIINDNNKVAVNIINYCNNNQLAIRDTFGTYLRGYYGEEGDTPLHCASRQNMPDIVKLLVDKLSHEQIIMQNKRGDTALHCCSESGEIYYEGVPSWVTYHSGHIEIVNILIKKMRPNDIFIRNIHDQTALDVAGSTKIKNMLHKIAKRSIFYILN